ncbi:MAG: HAD hydrolase-like protein [Anaerolineae bacterium]
MSAMCAFDLVGTLVRGDIFQDARNDFRLDCNRGWNKAERDVDFAHHFDYRAVIRRWLVLNDLALTEALHVQFKKYLIDNATHKRYLYTQAPQTLHKLHQAGFNLGFVTDGPDEIEGEMIRQILQTSDIPSQACVIVTGDSTGCPKSEGEPFGELIRLAKQHDVEKENIAFVGDKPKADIDGPKQAGIEKAILIARGEQPTPPLGKWSPWRTIKNLQEIWDILPGLEHNK